MRLSQGKNPIASHQEVNTIPDVLRREVEWENPRAVDALRAEEFGDADNSVGGDASDDEVHMRKFMLCYEYTALITLSL
jgi:hypothetical protein